MDPRLNRPPPGGRPGRRGVTFENKQLTSDSSTVSHVHPDGARLRLSGRGAGLVQPAGPTRYDDRKLLHNADLTIARITSDRPVQHLERLGFVLMTKLSGAASTAGIGFAVSHPSHQFR